MTICLATEKRRTSTIESISWRQNIFRSSTPMTRSKLFFIKSERSKPLSRYRLYRFCGTGMNAIQIATIRIRAQAISR